MGLPGIRICDKVEPLTNEVWVFVRWRPDCGQISQRLFLQKNVGLMKIADSVICGCDPGKRC